MKKEEKMDKNLQCISAGICAVCAFLFGRLDGLLYALIAFMILDYITGIIVACIQKKLSSATGFKGIAKKVFNFGACSRCKYSRFPDCRR